ncbi:MAG: MFS transporter [Gammaproteobacteria bacterium]|nr:MFS transporter [Gammaproteobacteria bacterium]
MTSETGDPGESVAETAVSRRPGGYAWYVAVVLFFVYLVNYVDRSVLNVLSQLVKDDLGASDTVMGFLVGPAFAVFYALAGIPIARYADRSNRIRIIAIGCLVWSGFTVATAYAQTWQQLAWFRIGVGIGEAAFLAPAYSILADYFPVRYRTRALSLLGLAVYFGQVTGMVTGAMLGASLGWRDVFIYAGLPGIAVAMIAWLTVREPVRGAQDSIERATEGLRLDLWGAIRQLWAYRSFRKLCFGTALGVFGGQAFAGWSAPFLMRSHGVDLVAIGTVFAPPYLLSALIGTVLAGFVADRLVRRNLNVPVKASSYALGLATAILCMACWVPSFTWLVILTIPMGLVGGGWVLPMQSSTQNALPPELRATGIAVFWFVVNLVGIAGGPWFTGFASDLLAVRFGNDSLRYALLLAVSVSFIGAAIIRSAGRQLHAEALSMGIQHRG